MHAPRAERDDPPVPRGPLAARVLRREAGGLTKQAEEGGLVLGPLGIDTLDDEHGVLGTEQRSLVHRGDVHREAFEAPRRLPETRQHAERPVRLREALETDLGLHALVESPGSEDLDGAIEVDVGDFARLDLGLGSDVEGALGLALHGNADTSRPGNKVHGLSQKGGGKSIDRETETAAKLASSKEFFWRDQSRTNCAH